MNITELTPEAAKLLQAAAPDLYAALEYFYNISHDIEISTAKGYIDLAQEQARAALDKAKGVTD